MNFLYTYLMLATGYMSNVLKIFFWEMNNFIFVVIMLYV